MQVFKFSFSVKSLLFCVLFLICSTFVNSQTKNKSVHKYELSAYNFGSLANLAALNQLEVLQNTGYKGIILNSQTKVDSTNLDVFLSTLKTKKDFKVHAVMVRYDFAEPFQKREGWKIIVDKIANRNVELWVIFGKKVDGYNAGFIETKLKEIVTYAKTKKVKVILYPHSNCVIASAEEALPFVRKIDDKNLKLAVHLCHEIRAGNGARINKVFDAVKGYIGAVTVCGSDSVADFSKPRLMDASTIKPIGQGNFNIQKFIIPLRKSGYKGLVGFINFKIEDDPETYLNSSILNWKECNLQKKLIDLK